MVELNCPLCCNQTFESPSSLKGHLLEILENLFCPMCNAKFCQLSELADHLETDCVEIFEINDEIQDVEKASEEVNDDQEIVEDSILARALLEGRQESKSENEEEIAQYYCQSCNVHFQDIDAHLREYHEDQEIVLEENVPDPLQLQSDGTDEEQPVILIVNPPEEEKPPSSLSPKKSNTIIEQDIKDKDGRLYTRKFVKIDKFWLQDEDPKDVSGQLVQENVESDSDYDEKTSKTTFRVTLCQTCNAYYPNNGTHVCEPKTSKKSHNCETCNTTFPTFKSLRLHRRMHEPVRTREVEAPANYEEGGEPERKMFVCTICYKTYDKEYEQVHMSSHECNNEFNCEVCNRKFYTKSNLEMHMKAHSNKKKFTCSYCKKLFVTYDALNEHLLNQCQKRPYACQYCGRRFSRPHEKVKHERIHTGEKPHVCDICGKAFRVSYCLTLHLRTHSGTRPYQCKHCGKRFKSHSVYNHHLLTHSDVRAYKCPYCPKAFKTSVQLAGHKNSHIKPFTCTECNRPFASLYAVRAHMETHKRENNLKYECWICGALYSRAFALRDHLKQQHQQIGEKEKTEVVGMEEEMEAANSILVNEDDIILGLDQAASIEIIEGEAE